MNGKKIADFISLGEKRTRRAGLDSLKKKNSTLYTLPALSRFRNIGTDSRNRTYPLDFLSLHLLLFPFHVLDSYAVAIS